MTSFDLRWESTLSVKCLIFELEKPHTIDQETNHIKYERNTPPQVKMENAKISVYVENPHYFKIFFSESVVEVA